MGIIDFEKSFRFESMRRTHEGIDNNDDEIAQYQTAHDRRKV